MNLKIGDKVRVLNENAEGKVVEFSSQKVSVEIDGFVYDYNADELVIADTELSNNYLVFEGNEEETAVRIIENEDLSQLASKAKPERGIG